MAAGNAGARRVVRLYSHCTSQVIQDHAFKIPPYPYLAPKAEIDNHFGLCRGGDETLRAYIMKTSGHGSINHERDRAILCQVLFAMQHLHENDYIVPVEYLNASKITFSDKYKSVVLSDFEPAPATAENKEVNIKRLGKLFYFVLSGTDGPDDFNDINPDNLVRCPEPHVASKLISSLLERSRSLKSTQDVLRHPYFWSAAKKISFIRKFYHLLKTRRNLRCQIESDEVKNRIFINEWSECLRVEPPPEPSGNDQPDYDAIWTLSTRDVEGVETYVHDSSLHLFRFIRNSHAHYWDGDNFGARTIFVDDTDGFWRFFHKRFPHLFMEAYKITNSRALMHLFEKDISSASSDCLVLPPIQP